MRERTNLVIDSYSGHPNWFQCPMGEFWQTEADPHFGGRLFPSIDYLAAGDEFGIQGHAIYYSGQGFCWYPSPHTAEGIQWKFRDLHRFAEAVYFNGRKVNHGKTYTGGHKLESPALGIVRAEQIIDSIAYTLGYRIAYEDHDGQVEDEPAGINNMRPSYFVYEAEYPNGARIVKIDMNGSLNDGCPGNTPLCETSAEAIRRFDNTVAARLVDQDTSRLYYFALVVHANGYFAGKHTEASGFPLRPDEYSALNTFLDKLQQRIQSGIRIKFVSPSELASIFYARRGITSAEGGGENIAQEFLLYQNYPNPFNPQTTIEYQLPLSGRVMLRIYNVLGQEVKTLVDEKQSAGSYSVIWDGKDNFGKDVTSGIYFFQLSVKGEHFKKTKKLLLLR